MMKLSLKYYWSLTFILLFLIGCSGHPGVIVPSLTPGTTIVLETPSKTPSPYIRSTNTPFSSATPTIQSTPVPYVTSTQILPTQAASVYQQVSGLGKGTYLLISGRNDYHDYSYILLTVSGEVVKSFRLNYSVQSFSSDFRFLTYTGGDPNSGPIYWASLDTPDKLEQLTQNCFQPVWSMDNEKLGLLCQDGIHIMEYSGNKWVESFKIDRPKEIRQLPDDVNLFNFSGWMTNGFAFFVDYRFLVKNSNYPYNFYVISNDCLNKNHCDLITPRITMDNGPITAVAMSQENSVIAIYASDKGQIQIYNVQTRKMIKAINISSMNTNENLRLIDSIVWGKQKDQLLIGSPESTKIYQLQGLDPKNFQPFFDCSIIHIYDCSILSWISI